MATCNICKYAGTPSYKSPCSECKGYSKYEYEKPVTNADRIRAMSDEELADYLAGIAYARNTPWSNPFNRKFCDDCPTTEVTIQETGQTMELTECDFVDGKCPHGSDIVWWLQQPAEEVP